MRQKLKRSSTLPEVISNNVSYAFRAIQLAKLHHDDQTNNIRLDEGYGDKNMGLFRLKARKKIIQEVPTAFTREIRQLLLCKTDSSVEISIANAHNEEIQRILNTSKEQYNLGHRQELQKQMTNKRQMLKNSEYQKGIDNQLRQYNQHLSFGYLPAYQSNNWFTIKDSSKDYQPLPIIPLKPPSLFIKDHSKVVKTQRKSRLMHISSFKSK